MRKKAVVRLMLAFFVSSPGAVAGGEGARAQEKLSFVSCQSAAASEKGRTQENTPLTVLELFTSQGCSSCPPADALLGKMAQCKNFLALTMPVNYWDYLGWKDTLASEEFSKRQRAYAQARGDNEIYTPQIVINGMAHVVGSREGAIEAAIHGTRNERVFGNVPLKTWYEGNDIVVHAATAPNTGEYRTGTVWVVLYTSAVNVDIRRGENNGKQITYSNVVRQLVQAGRWEGKAGTFRVPRPNLTTDVDGVAALLQAEGPNAIIGAAILTPKTN